MGSHPKIKLLPLPFVASRLAAVIAITSAQGAQGVLSMSFRPLHDRVLIRRVEGEEKTPGGIIIPDTAQEKPMEGDIIAAGPGARGEDGKIHPLDVKAGDRVLFGKWSGTEIKIDGEELIIMKEADIMGVIAN
jgi:chaperonin GroES